MPAFNDTAAYPVFLQATAKREIIRFILEHCQNSPVVEDLVYRINNTVAMDDLTTVYDPANTFAVTS